MYFFLRVVITTKNRKKVIVKLKLKFETKIETILFGNSYKNWDQQFREFCWIYKPIEILSAESSKEKWISWGGLKWCDFDIFQDELNREDCEENEPDNPDPRKIEEFVFNTNKIVFNKCKKYILESIKTVKK